jgi:hypothetical protein
VGTAVAGGVQQGGEGAERGGDELPATPFALYTFREKSGTMVHSVVPQRAVSVLNTGSHVGTAQHLSTESMQVFPQTGRRTRVPHGSHTLLRAPPRGNHTLGERGAPTSRMSSTGVLRPPDANYITGNLRVIYTRANKANYTAGAAISGSTNSTTVAIPHKLKRSPV